MREDKHRYDDMLDLPHHVSAVHPPMSMDRRAAQFSPFAALTGYDAVVAEAARLTDRKLELDEEEKGRIDRRLRDLKEREKLRPSVRVSYFLPDERKEGGAVRTVTGAVKKVDEYAGVLLLADGTAIPFEDIYAVEEERFPG